ncbi:MAG: IgA Peptidase M64 [Melioribacteraceae bacterium]|nr:IgA Peptidase M64 [Melioribacteraceae bacterium]
MKIWKLFFLFPSLLIAQIQYDDYFTEKTMRFDFTHFGDKYSEEIGFDKIIEEGDWAGTRTNLIDPFGYGNYKFILKDTDSNKEIFSMGFSTLFMEWQTTEEAKTVKRTYEGSIRFPFPKANSILEIYRRDKRGDFVKKIEYSIDPQSYFIHHEMKYQCPNFKVHYSGNSYEKLDIVFVPEGYTKEEMGKFKKDCERLSKSLFSYEPFSNFQNNINVWGVEAPSNDSGTDIPGDNVWKNTIMGSNFYTFDSERYLMTTNYFDVRDIAANAPYDQIYIIVNTSKYGGGAIYNYYSLTGADHKLAGQVFVHEFGHGLAGLADEYSGDDTYQDFYPLDVEPWEPNVTTLVNFDNKWKSMIDKDTPIPTPTTDEFKNKVGVFEGAGYVAKGVYRPSVNSLMNSFSVNEFNPVCKKVLSDFINYYSK